MGRIPSRGLIAQGGVRAEASPGAAERRVEFLRISRDYIDEWRHFS